MCKFPVLRTMNPVILRSKEVFKKGSPGLEMKASGLCLKLMPNEGSKVILTKDNISEMGKYSSFRCFEILVAVQCS